ncbi:MAG TPA: class I SAM-dependent methyltransferase, partial [Candidatus Polarisedimenticolia bacterium]|nr:class I SAM-dependent methyltransferase [Candidatus Polarisedimenticolia bacterium]
TRVEGSEIMEGALECAACGGTYPVRGGVPRFVEASGLAGTPGKKAGAFGWEWKAFPRVEEHHERQFLDWIAPAGPETFAGRLVLEGGCGKGRHTRLAARYGAKAVIGVDLSEAVDVAYRNTRELANAHVVQADLLRLPVAPASLDYAFSIGVLHHLAEPGRGFASLSAVVRPGGAVSAWVYGAENNGWIVRVVSPLRGVLTSRLPPRLLYGVSFALAVPLWVALRLLYRPARKRGMGWARRLLFYESYLGYISDFPFHEIHHIVHDHLAAPVAHYLRRDEVEAWFREAGVAEPQIGWHNRNSWRGYGVLQTQAGRTASAGRRS